MKAEEQHGDCEGEVCNRKGCVGIIERHPVVNCSCHLNPPCSACTAPANYCATCGWEEKDEIRVNGFDIQVDPVTREWKSWEPHPLDPTKIDYRIQSHTNSSQICEGVYPEGTTAAEVVKEVKGTFGGRFEHFGNGRFKYIAYTD